MMMSLYDDLAAFRKQLQDREFGEWASSLLAAERSAMTSGEAISNLSPILRRLAAAESVDGEMRRRAAQLLAVMDKAWGPPRRDA